MGHQSLLKPKAFINYMNQYYVRDACLSDLDGIFHLSKHLNTLNLPANKADLANVIWQSSRSFSNEEKDKGKQIFIFVLVNQNNDIIGTSQIIAKHGTIDSPHHYFQIDVDERYSHTLNKVFRHRTLKLNLCFDGPTEIGGLILDPAFRTSPLKLGTFLSFARFLFIAQRPGFFNHQILAELLPPLGENFTSALWNALGLRFTGLSYYEADMISRSNKEFIKTLFPANEIYVSLLPGPAQEVIGQVGPSSKGAQHLLTKIGFTYQNRVDPFDGGPHFEAFIKDISLIKEAKTASFRLGNNPYNFGILGHFNPEEKEGLRFKAVCSPFSYIQGQIFIPKTTQDSLMVETNQKITAIGLE
jgi:arginine N-succinyltransferase